MRSNVFSVTREWVGVKFADKNVNEYSAQTNHNRPFQMHWLQKILHSCQLSTNSTMKDYSKINVLSLRQPVRKEEKLLPATWREYYMVEKHMTSVYLSSDDASYF